MRNTAVGLSKHFHVKNEINSAAVDFISSFALALLCKIITLFNTSTRLYLNFTCKIIGGVTKDKRYKHTNMAILKLNYQHLKRTKCL